MTTHFDSFHRVIVIDWELCKKCNMFNDNWGRQGVTPFTVACYIYHALHTLNKTPEEVFDAVMNKWDSLVWRQSPISIILWNKLFNGVEISQSEWGKILFPLSFIDTIYTNVTSEKTKHECHPMFLGIHQQVPSEFLMCTDESYRKAIVEKTAVKVTAYRYGHATGNFNILQGLREETSKVIIPL